MIRSWPRENSTINTPKREGNTGKTVGSDKRQPFEWDTPPKTKRCGGARNTNVKTAGVERGGTENQD